MGKITIQDILGSDNVGSSRAVIQSNTRLLADGINKIETFLNTTPTGGSLNIANILINKGSLDTDEEIFHNQASSRIDGKLRVLQQLHVGTGEEEFSEFESDISVTGKINIERPSTNNEDRISNLTGSVSFGDVVSFGGVNLSGYLKFDASDSEDNFLEVLAFESDDEEISGKNNITLQWAGTNKEVELSDGYHGQILIIKNTGAPPDENEFTLVHKEDGGNTNIPIVKYENIGDTVGAELEKITTVLIFEAVEPGEDAESKQNGSWKVISSKIPTDVTEKISFE